MQKLGLLLGISLLTVALYSCEKEEITLDPDTLPAERIRFSGLQVGQRSYYLLSEIDVRSGGEEVRYTGDTLIVEITGREGGTFLVEERFTAGSPMYDTVITRYCDVIRYGLQTGGGGLAAIRTIDCAGSYLFDVLPQTLPLLPGTDARAELDGWRVEPFDDGNDDLILNGYVEDFHLFGVHYPRLLVQVDPSQEPLDGNKLSWLYSDDVGIVRAVIFNGFAGRGMMADLWVGPQ
jgi:hypothetical protein